MREHLEKQEGDCKVNEKKVVTVIVEGPSDENAIGGILKEFFSSEEVQFAVVHGDITSNYSISPAISLMPTSVGPIGLLGKYVRISSSL